MKAYKVIQVLEDGKYVSYNYQSLGNYGIEYKEGETVKAKIGGLFIFERLKDAKKFVEEYSCLHKLIIFEILVNENKIKDIYKVLSLDYYKLIESYWLNNMIDRQDIYWEVPLGTKVVDKLTVIKKVLL